MTFDHIFRGMALFLVEMDVHAMPMVFDIFPTMIYQRLSASLSCR